MISAAEWCADTNWRKKCLPTIAAQRLPCRNIIRATLLSGMLFIPRNTCRTWHSCNFLKQMRSAFKKRYELSELNIDYYISQMEGCSLLKWGSNADKGVFPG